jgi:hypothetical protein
MSEDANRRLRIAPTIRDDGPPTLDDIARDATIVARLTPEQAEGLAPQCAAVLAAVTTRASQRLVPMADDRVIDSGEFAALLGKSRSWVEHHLADLPPRVTVLGSPGWLLSAATRFLKHLGRYGESR